MLAKLFSLIICGSITFDKVFQHCGTTIVANVIKTIYYALTCANALVFKMKMKVKIINLTKTMNTILARKICFSLVLKIIKLKLK